MYVPASIVAVVGIKTSLKGYGTCSSCVSSVKVAQSEPVP